MCGHVVNHFQSSRSVCVSRESVSISMPHRKSARMRESRLLPMSHWPRIAHTQAELCEPSSWMRVGPWTIGALALYGALRAKHCDRVTVSGTIQSPVVQICTTGEYHSTT